MTTKEVFESFTREEAVKLYNSKTTDKELYDLFIARGLTDSYDTFLSEAQKTANEKFSKMSKKEILEKMEGIELSNEQLEQIAGGDINDLIIPELNFPFANSAFIPAF